MGKGQGIRRLTEGVTRSLTPHEMRRGYVFVSYDKQLPSILSVNEFEVEIAGNLVKGRRIDVSGRVHIPRKLLALVSSPQKVTIKVTSACRLQIKQG